MKWRGRLGVVILGPTEHRVALALDARTRHGRVTLRSEAMAAALGLSRSELYRITRRLRILGLFGIENDRGGTKGGRRYWRTERRHEYAELAPAAHRLAWARVTGYLKAAGIRVAARLRSYARAGIAPVPPLGDGSARALSPAPHGPNPHGGAGTFVDAMRRYAPALAAEWRL